MDITIEVDDYILNMRAAGIIKHNGKILFHKNKNKDHYCLIGGRIEIGEDSKTAVRREISEELGKTVIIGETISIVENFFVMNNKKYHEILFIHKAEFEDEEDKKIQYNLKNIEGKENMIYVWIDEKELENNNIYPKGINKILINGKKCTHEILKNE